MDGLTPIIKKNIKTKYKSVRRFSEALGVPQSTVVSALKKGVSGTAFDTVCRMCSLLDIKLVDGLYPVSFDEAMKDIIEKSAFLDAMGKHAVHTVLLMEYNRCTQKDVPIDFSLLSRGDPDKSVLASEDSLSPEA